MTEYVPTHVIMHPFDFQFLNPWDYRGNPRFIRRYKRWRQRKRLLDLKWRKRLSHGRR